MRVFPVSLPSGQRYWTVLDEDLQVVGVADEYLRHLRFGRDAAESTTKAYAYSIALFLRWCGRSGRARQGGRVAVVPARGGSVGPVLAGRCRAVRVVHDVAGPRPAIGR